MGHEGMTDEDLRAACALSNWERRLRRLECLLSWRVYGIAVVGYMIFSWKTLEAGLDEAVIMVCGAALLWGVPLSLCAGHCRRFWEY